mmetsp:Transcript_638/g.1118  ORF Transcript_638/g.1118 Transcript_638/m.1118 type:complete len:214 (-) Transcript_638:1244-1885(-)
MGKLITSQRKGKVGIFKIKKKSNLGKTSYRTLDYIEKCNRIRGKIKKFFINPITKQPIVRVEFCDSTTKIRSSESFISVSGLSTTQSILCGSKSSIKVGNVLPLFRIKLGCSISNLEEFPGSGGNISKSSGTFCGIMTHLSDKILTKIKLPSNKIKCIDSKARCTIGVVSNCGKLDIPLMKAGSSYYKHKNRLKRFPKVFKKLQRQDQSPRTL